MRNQDLVEGRLASAFQIIDSGIVSAIGLFIGLALAFSIVFAAVVLVHELIVNLEFPGFFESILGVSILSIVGATCYTFIKESWGRTHKTKQLYRERVELYSTASVESNTKSNSMLGRSVSVSNGEVSEARSNSFNDSVGILSYFKLSYFGVRSVIGLLSWVVATALTVLFLGYALEHIYLKLHVAAAVQSLLALLLCYILSRILYKETMQAILRSQELIAAHSSASASLNESNRFDEDLASMGQPLTAMNQFSEPIRHEQP